MARRPVIAGNWKMYKTIAETQAYMHAFAALAKDAQAEVMLAVPFTAIHAASQLAKNTSVLIGAQNMHDAEEGAFTGEISAGMLKEAGAQFVILGHSERRQLFQETNAFVHRKLKRALHEHLLPILCIGETQEMRDRGKTEQVLFSQLGECLEGVPASQIVKVIIAYEPVWAIGTGKTATPEIAQDAHFRCRQFLKKHWGEEAAGQMRIVYGGSVKPETIAGQLAQPDIDGALIGGASLNPETFAKMINEIKG